MTYQTSRAGRNEGLGNFMANPPVRNHGMEKTSVDRKVRVQPPGSYRYLGVFFCDKSVTSGLGSP